MPATFNDDLQNPVDRVRFDLGDTDTAAAMLQDETITAMLSHHGEDERLATIALASALITRFALEPDKVSLADSEGAVEWRNRLAGWQALVKRLQGEIAAAAIAASTGFTTRRPARYGEEGGEYYAGGRWVPEW